MTPPDALSRAFAAGDTATVLAEALHMEGATSVLDIGCGRGALSRSLADRGFATRGVEPGEAAIRAARETAPDLTFDAAVAEKLPYADESFDAAIFVNSLHHVPVAAMEAALREAARVTVSGGTVFVVEPLAEGPQFETVRPIDDETEVRHAAAVAVADALRASLFTLRGNVVYERRERFADLDAFLDRVVAVDPARAALAREKRAEVAALFERNAVQEGGAHVLVQPLRIYWLRRP
ncbi:methylase [Aurantimonas sp. Leaf443]|nr:methylase [Aurantimonas sp. Leaf443]